MICPTCGEIVSPKSGYCLHCGQPLHSTMEHTNSNAFSPTKDPIHAVAAIVLGLIFFFIMLGLIFGGK